MDSKYMRGGGGPGPGGSGGPGGGMRHQGSGRGGGGGGGDRGGGDPRQGMRGHRGGGGGGGGGGMGGGDRRGSGGRGRPRDRDDMDVDGYDPSTVLGGGQQAVTDDDDDNANAGADVESDEEAGEKEDPLLVALDDLEGRIVAALDELKLHPGVASSTVPGAPTVHDELRDVLRPILDIAAHVGPAAARTNALYRAGGADQAVEEVYQRINSDLVFPVVLEAAQSDPSSAKRAAALRFFHSLHDAWRGAGSYLDTTAPPNSPHAGPYGVGGAMAAPASVANMASLRPLLKRRAVRRSAHLGELLRYWVEAAASCSSPGSFDASGDDLDGGAIAARAVLSAGAAVKPALRHVADKIASADDAGALRLYSPLMRMMGGALKRLFASGGAAGTEGGGDAPRAAGVKFLEIVVASFSPRAQPGVPAHVAAATARKTKAENDFALEDLPTGHPVITREALEEIGEYAYTALRGLVIVGGQVKIDPSLLDAGATDRFSVMGAAGMGGKTPSSQVVDAVRPAALAYMEIESAAVEAMDAEAAKMKGEDKDDDKDEEEEDKDPPDFKLDRSELESDFALSHQSYALAINAVAMLATNRPVYYRDSATCLARRIVDPPDDSSAKDAASSASSGGGSALSKAAALAVRHQLRSSCVTLLRNPLSVTSGGWDVLRRALARTGMALQASRALKAAQQQAALRKAGRAARNRAAIYYEWEQQDTTTAEDERSSKRQRRADDALAKMRKDKAARGLGGGIQLPSSIVDAAELVLANLGHLPKKRPPGPRGTSAPGRKPATLDFVVDAIMTNGASLSADESKWYERDGGAAWTVAEVEEEEDQTQRTMTFSLDGKTLEAAEEAYRNGATIRGTMTKKPEELSSTPGKDKKVDDSPEGKARLFDEQCLTAASDAFGRIVARSSAARSPAVADLGHRVAARLAWTLRSVGPPNEGVLREASVISGESVTGGGGEKKRKKEDDDGSEGEKTSKSLRAFADEFPLVSSCLALDVVPAADAEATSAATLSGTSSCLANRVLNEAYLESISDSDGDGDHKSSINIKAEEGDDKAATEEDATPTTATKKNDRYERSLELYVSSVVRASERANDKPNDAARRTAATAAAASLPRRLAAAPSVTPSSLALVAALCDIEELTKKANEASRKAGGAAAAAQGGGVTGAAAGLSAAKISAEKRATQALLALRDAAFQRSKPDVRRGAVDCAVGVAAGRLPASPSVEEKALKLVMNVLFPRSSDLADCVVRSASDELERAARFAAENCGKIQAANEEAMAKKGDHQALLSARDRPQPLSDEEKVALETVRKPVVLFMALCVRRPDIVGTLVAIGSRPKADVLAKAIRNNMSKLARAVVTKYGAAKIARQVAEQTGVAKKEGEDGNDKGDDGSKDEETTRPLFLSFLGNLVPIAEKEPPGQDIIDACHEIQKGRAGPDGQLDPRYVIPVVSGIKRDDLVTKLPQFVSAEDDVFKAALRRMGERLKKYALVFRDEPPNPDVSPALRGMTLCEDLVYLHRLDFSSVGLPQKRYLDAIRICLDDDEVFSDRVVMAALDYMSGTFLAGDDGLPLAFMRTIILTCSKHESLHSWICHVLLPRLIEGRVYDDRRQWEGWMRCAKMLENAGDGVSSLDAIEKLPEEQLRMYRAKYPKKG